MTKRMSKRTRDIQEDEYHGKLARIRPDIRLPEPLARYVKNITAKTAGQDRLLEAIQSQNVVLALGPAGTGKTYMAVAYAAQMLDQGKIKKMILSRPAVEAGEHLGFLPGDMGQKLDPYLRPLYDVLYERMGTKRVEALLAEKIIEICPLAFMRGRTLSNAAIILDEAQNCSYTQLKMALTRLGWGSTMVVTGDPDQVDIPIKDSGLADIANRLDGLEGCSVVRLNETDVVRHPMVSRMLSVI